MQGQLYLAAIGLCNAVNCVIIVYASPPARTPPELQAILLNGVTVCTFLLSRVFLSKRYSRREMRAVAALSVGLLLSLVPTLADIVLGEPLRLQEGYGIVLA